MENFKAFKGGKSKAKKGLERFDARLVEFADTLLVQVDGEWGFHTDIAEQMLDVVPDAVESTSESVTEEQENENDSDETEPDIAPVASGNMFGSIANTLEAVAVTTPAPAQRQAPVDRGPYTIEKVRPTQNGVTRPSAGGLCRAVWDKMDELSDSLGSTPTPSAVRVAAAENNWNANNAMIEYYQWRKFNGISGRIVPKKTAPVAASSTGEPVAA